MRTVFACTRCCLFLEVVYNADDGSYGHFLLEKWFNWPGVPMVGQSHVDLGDSAVTLRPDGFKVKEVASVDDPDDEEPYLHVSLLELDLAKWQRERNEINAEMAEQYPDMTPRDVIVVNKATCIETIQAFMDDGWKMTTHVLRWKNEDGTEQPDVIFDRSGNVVGDDDEDDDFEDEEFDED